MSSLLIKNVNIIDPNSEFNNSKKDILLKNGLIIKIEDNIEVNNSETILEENLHVCPGLFDFSVDFPEPGNEQRETFSFKHNRLKINNWIDHKKLLKIYEKASISVVNPTWQEPFGRTALESASRGCAVITSISGGLNETFKNNLILKKNSVDELTKTLTNLIENKNLLKKIQTENFNNVMQSLYSSG